MNPISIDQYISGADSICREERQYALYLHNILLGIKRKINGEKPQHLSKEEQVILDACGLGSAEKIDNVFYEATFMRDIFEHDRKNYENYKNHEEYLKNCFNSKLLDYICGTKGIPQKEKDRLEGIKSAVGKKNSEGYGYNLGANAGQKVLSLELEQNAVIPFIARVMMNVKPDIAVLYKKQQDENGHYLRFIECKYLSKESQYYKNAPMGYEKTTQRMAQNWVAEFLHENYFPEDMKIEEIEKKASELVQFTSDLKGGEGISIATLISMNDELF